MAKGERVVDSVYQHPGLVCDVAVREAYSADVSGLSNVPDAVARPQSSEEVADLVRYASAHGIPITAQGLRSSTTGASVPCGGIALSLERMSRILEIDRERRIARVEPGVVLGPFKREVLAAGLFYPPDPTSENECTIGGTIATNASGPRTYRYGSTRAYVRSLEVVLADGRVHTVQRSRVTKNSSGYAGLQDPVDLWIGSEGTLGIVTAIELQLLPRPAGWISGLAWFPDWQRAIRFIVSADRARAEGTLAPRCLELFDRGSLALVSELESGFHPPEGTGGAVYFEQETSEADRLEVLERWYLAIEAGEGLADETRIATTEIEQQELRRIRHAVPARSNELGSRAAAAGGRKLSTDFAVALDSVEGLIGDCYAIAAERFGGPTVLYGHLGSGHPHVNLLADDPAALRKAWDAVRGMTERALDLGGVLSAEHGIGKIKAPYFVELGSPWVVESMRAVKTALDPKGIFAPGNLFPV